MQEIVFENIYLYVYCADTDKNDFIKNSGKSIDISGATEQLRNRKMGRFWCFSRTIKKHASKSFFEHAFPR